MILSFLLYKEAVRAIETGILIKKPSRRVWKGVSSLSFCRTLTDSFWRFGRNLRYDLIHPEGVDPSEDAETLILGSRVAVTTGFNRPWIDWTATASVPGELLVLRAERPGWLDGYHMVVRCELEVIDDEKCRLNIKLYVMFLNRGLELASLLLPLAFLYRMCITAALNKTKKTIERG